MEFINSAQYLTSDSSSYAFVAVNDRWPMIVTSAINDVQYTLDNSVDNDIDMEGKSIIEQLETLRNEMQNDRPLKSLSDDGNTDIELYNVELCQSRTYSWKNAPWLFTECYLYRRIQSLFWKSNLWKECDVFSRQKTTTFRSSQPAVLELASRYRDIISALEVERQAGSAKSQSLRQAEKSYFLELCEVCLWGNATDLSLLTKITYEDIQKLQGSEARKTSQHNIIANDLDAAFEAMQKACIENGGACRVDIVLDNSGFELYTDLILAGYLLSTRLATSVVLHQKTFPWFVSDTTPKDISDLLASMAEPRQFYNGPPGLSDQEVESLKHLSQQWRLFQEQGMLTVRSHPFWTTPSSYWYLPRQAPDLFEGLQRSDLVLFKGDLNYRKLTGDAKWPTTTPFPSAIGPMGINSGIRVLAFRTCKSDPVVGLASGTDESLRELPGGGSPGVRKWAWSGKWAIMSFSDGKS